MELTDTNPEPQEFTIDETNPTETTETPVETDEEVKEAVDED